MINGAHSPFFDRLMFAISDRWVWIPSYAILLYLIIDPAGKRRWKTAALVIATIYLADKISVYAFKEVFQRLRPTHTEGTREFLHLVNGYRGGKFSFVSSHATNCFALSMLTSRILRLRPVTLTLFLWAAIVSYSRVYLGVHYPGDVTGGAILGTTVGYLASLLARVVDPPAGSLSNPPA